jgi:hypothetical protein
MCDIKFSFNNLELDTNLSSDLGAAVTYESKTTDGEGGYLTDTYTYLDIFEVFSDFLELDAADQDEVAIADLQTFLDATIHGVYEWINKIAMSVKSVENQLKTSRRFVDVLYDAKKESIVTFKAESIERITNMIEGYCATIELLNVDCHC